MCPVTVYLGEREIAREVIWVEKVEGGVRLATILDRPRIVAGSIKSIDLLGLRILLEPLPPQANGQSYGPAAQE